MVARLLLDKTDQAQFLTTEKVSKNDGDHLQKNDDDFDKVSILSAAGLQKRTDCDGTEPR